MPFKLVFTEQAKIQLQKLQNNSSYLKQFKAVCKTLGHIEINPRHSGLHTHKYHTIMGANGEEIFQSYAENKTPCAYRIFWHYGSGKNIITIIAIIPHP